MFRTKSVKYNKRTYDVIPILSGSKSQKEAVLNGKVELELIRFVFEGKEGIQKLLTDLEIGNRVSYTNKD